VTTSGTIDQVASRILGLVDRSATVAVILRRALLRPAAHFSRRHIRPGAGIPYGRVSRMPGLCGCPEGLKGWLGANVRNTV
jgi:hypothetical protein